MRKNELVRLVVSALISQHPTLLDHLTFEVDRVCKQSVSRRLISIPVHSAIHHLNL